VALDRSSVLGLKDDERGTQEFTLGNHDNVEAGRDATATKNLSDQTLRAISDNRTARLPSCRHAKPADSEAVRLKKQRVVAARNACAVCIDLLKFRTASNPLCPAKLQRVSRC